MAEVTVPVIDPVVGSDNASSIALLNLYDSLVFPNPDGTVRPLLAKDWSVSSDGLVWTFNLRNNVTFHDGTGMTAEDVVFSMQRLLKIGQGYAYLFSGTVKDVKATGKYTVQFALKKVFAPFLYTLDRLYIVNKAQVMSHIVAGGAYGKMGDYGMAWLANQDAGSGPYTLKALVPQQSFTADKFANYWGGWSKKAPDSLQLTNTTQATTVRTLFSRGELDVSDENQTPQALQTLHAMKGVAITKAFLLAQWVVGLNTKKAPTDDVHVRRALAYVLDYSVIYKNIFVDSVKPRAPVPFDIVGFASNLPQFEHNLALAKQELAQSRYANDISQYPIELVWITEASMEEKLALLLQADAAQIGIKIEIVSTPWAKFVDDVSKVATTPNASIVEVIADYDEAGSFLSQRYDSQSAGSWTQVEWLQNPAVDSALADALGTLDREARLAKYAAIQKMIVDLCPTVWVADYCEVRAYRADRWDWPTADLRAAGKSTGGNAMGYDFYFHDWSAK